MKNAKGFTLVELLIVIVVIAILAAITLVTYNGVQDRARVTEVKSDLSNIHKATALLRVEDASYTTNATWISALKQAGVYDATAPGSTTKTFMFCANTESYAIGAWYPFRDATLSTVYYDSSMDGLTQLDGHTISGISNFCDAVLPSATYRVWAHNGSLHP